MDDYRVPTQYDDEEFPKGQHVTSNYGNEPSDAVDSAIGLELKPRFDHRDSSPGKLFVGGLSWETTEEAFANYFSKYGEIVDSVIMMDKHTGRPRGFGFVTFSDPAIAESVLQEDHVIDGRMVEVKRTVPRDEMDNKGVSRTKKIFVGGIPASLTEDELKEYFSSYGTVIEHQIMLDRNTGRSRGFGFVTFENEDAVEKIFSEGRNHELGGRQVEIKKAEPKRGFGDYSGGSSRSYGSFGNSSRGHGGEYSSRGRSGGKTSRGYGGNVSGDGFNNYGAGYYGGAAGYYGGYGGYGYGYGFGGPMYGASGYVGNGYGMVSGYGGGIGGYGAGKGYGNMGGSSDGSGYGTGKGFENGGAGKGYGNRGYNGDGNSAYGGGKGFDNGGGYKGYGNRGVNGDGSGGYGGGRGVENGNAVSERFHPYQR